MRFFFNLKEIRNQKGINQTILARKLNITQQQISRYERGLDTPPLDKLVDIAVALDVSLDDLIEIKKIHAEYSEEMKKG